MKKNLVFISLEANNYICDIQKKYPNYNVIPIQLEWRYNLISDWIELVKQKTEFIKIDLLVGFSVGGVIALLAGPDIKPLKIDIYSPSPFFKEFLACYSKTLLNITGKKRLFEIKNLRVKDFKKCCETKIFVGSEELEIMKDTAASIAKQFGSKLIIINGKNHRNILEQKTS